MLRGLKEQGLCVRFSPDGKLLAASGGQTSVPHDKPWPSRIKVWDAGSHAELRTIEAHSNSIPALAFSPDGKTLASGSMDQTVKLWDTATGKLRETIVPGETGASSATGHLMRSSARIANSILARRTR